MDTTELDECPPIGELSYEELLKEATDKSKIFYVGMHNRPGVRQFMVCLEYRHFVPDTPANNNYNFYILKWKELGWLICSIPADKADIADAVAEKCKLRAANNIPCVMTESGFEQFPLHGDNVRTLENVKDHPVYNNNQEEIQNLLDEESVKIKEIMDEHKRRYDAGEFGRF